MKKINYILIALVVIIIAFIQSCNDDSIKINDIEKNSYIYKGKKYSPEELEVESLKISSTDVDNLLFNHFGVRKIDLYSVNEIIKKELGQQSQFEIVKYQIENTDEYLSIAQNITNPEIYRSFKTIEFNGKIDILNQKEINLNNILNKRYITEYKDLNLSKASILSLSFAAEICQRVGNETQSQCEDREYDEFVEDCFTCWVAFWTHPPIPVMISALCLC